MYLSMRRAIAISLMMLFSWTLIAPLLPVDAEANLPPCCRANGKHHCMCRMRHRLGNQKGLVTITEKCPCCPASASTPASPTYKPEAAAAHHAEAVFLPALAPRTETHPSIEFLRSHPKRGPPTPLA
jgi:hypothetical protein